MVLLEVVDANGSVALPAVGDNLGLAVLHAAEPAQLALLDEVEDAVIAKVSITRSGSS